MSAAVLREAAALMRSRATHPDVSGSPWEASPHGDVHDDGSLWVCDSQSGETAEHIASWHPAVALAVADWLDTAGADWWAHGGPHCADGCIDCDDDPWAPHLRRALAVARAYLGGAS